MLFKDHLYYLTEEDGRCLQVVNGIVTSLANQQHLVDTPLGWQDLLISWEKDMKKAGVIRTFGTPMELPWDGAKIVGHTTLTENIERKIFLLIKKLSVEFDDINDTINFIYRFLYRGELDLSATEGEEDTVKCNIMEGSLSKLLKANQGTVFEYPFDDEAIMVKMDGMFIQGAFKWFVTANKGNSLGASMIAGMTQLNNDNVVPGLVIFDTQQISSVGSPNADNLQYFAKSTQNITGVRLKATIPDFTSDIFLPLLNLEVWNEVSNNLRLTINLAPNPPYPSGSTLVIDQLVDLVAGDRLFLRGAATYAEFELQLEASSKYPTTYIQAYKAFDLYRRIIHNVAEEPLLVPGVDNAAKSDLLQANNNIAITCGDANRGLANARIKTHLNDFFDAMNAVLNAGMGIMGDKIELEEKAYFFDASDPYHLGEAKGLTWKWANDVRGNVVKIGYPKQNIDDVNGKYAFNNTHIYRSPITRIVKDIEIISPYLTDPFYIEINRLNLDGKTTTDNSSDNDVLMLSIGDPVGPASEELFCVFYADGNKIGIGVHQLELVKGQKIKITGGANDGKIFRVLSVETLLLAGYHVYVDGPVVDDLGGVTVTIEIVAGRVYELRRYTYDNQNDPEDFGIPSPTTTFNIEPFSPKRMLRRHGNWLRSLFWQFDNQKLGFNSTEVNGNLKTIRDGVTIKESDDQLIMDLDPMLFKPVDLEFEIDVPVDLVEILEANPQRCFSVDWLGIRYVGFLRKAAIAPASGASQTFVLLSAPGNNLSKLIQ